MVSTYIYRFFKSTWGIYVELTAELISCAAIPAQSVEIVPSVYLSIEAPYLLAIEQEYVETI